VRVVRDDKPKAGRRRDVRKGPTDVVLRLACPQHRLQDRVLKIRIERHLGAERDLDAAVVRKPELDDPIIGLLWCHDPIFAGPALRADERT
jgi:hypothetical protein